MKIGVMLSMFPEPHETFILRELAELERQGVEIEICSLQRPRDPITHADARRLAARTHYGGLAGWPALAALARACLRHPLRLLAMITRLAAAGWREPGELAKSRAVVPLALHFGAALRARGIRHIHGHWRNIPTTACWILQAVEGFSWSAAIHGENIFTRNAFLARKLADARFVVVCTRYSWSYLRERMNLPRPEDVHVNYHGLDPVIWHEVERVERDVVCAPGRPVILAVGRLFAFKGYAYLLPALKQLLDEGADVELRVVGQGPCAEELRALAASLGIASRVTWLGLVPFARVVAEMRCAAVLAQASIYMEDDHFDGIPNVIAEAMALGKPVVATRVSGIPELVEDGVSGLLVPEKDAPALAGALRRVLEDPALAARLGAAARQRVRALFDLERNVGELVGILRRYVGP